MMVLLATGISLVITILMGPLMIPVLTKLKFGQTIREEGPQAHFKKAGTPTMGGIMFITAVMLTGFLLGGRSGEVLCAVLVMLTFGAIGFWDDYIKVVLKRSLGLRARDKLFLQLIAATVFWLLLEFYLGRGSSITVPFTAISFDPGPYLYLVFLIIVLMSSSNGANLTDGLDGLAAGVTFFISVAFAFISLITLHYPLGIFCGALAGGCLGFLVFNHYPARVFMGDTGSMALGGGVAAIAALTKSELALIIIAGVYVIETLSVIIQVACFQTTGKRPFLMAPLHHHYELKGWRETKVVRFFWIWSFLFAIAGVVGYLRIWQ
ncbi:MAG: phospho-N-acetylmuramoyl-pentapeptide-transferase [Syntrophomonadaceae bacterium]|nr:phospho-N-acetylmuramoyl-pentapeptide-transferase [Syntrophomonadaceae bacterium]